MQIKTSMFKVIVLAIFGTSCFPIAYYCAYLGNLAYFILFLVFSIQFEIGSVTMLLLLRIEQLFKENRDNEADIDAPDSTDNSN